MILWIALGAAILAGLITPFTNRLQATGLWLGKALIPEDASDALPRGLQDALTDGWPSWLGLVGGILPYLATIVGLFHAWWAGILAFLVAQIISYIAAFLTRPHLESYLAIFLAHTFRRSADFAKHNDVERAEVARELAKNILAVIQIYLKSGVPAPTMKLARAAPFGDPKFLLDQYKIPNQPNNL